MVRYVQRRALGARMTALDQYQRLEASGIWRETPNTQARDVIVSFGDATLVLTDLRSEIPLAHWSLAAVTRLNPGKLPARYGPGGADSDEEVEVDDELMISAIGKVHRVIESRRPSSGRLRQTILLGVAGLMLFLGMFWLPSALIRHVAEIAPPAQRAEIGQQILQQVTQITGPFCSRPAGDMARRVLADRIAGIGSELVIVPNGLGSALTLPGNLTVLGEDLIAGPHSPEVAAGHILAATTYAQLNDPLLDALRYAGPKATFILMTNGRLPDKALQGYGERLLAAPPPRPDDEPLLERFARAGISSEPYARSIDDTGETVLGLIEADPFRTQVPKSVLSDRDWIALQEICDQ